MNASVDALAWTLIHFVWQGALLGVAAFFALRVVRPERASTRYLIAVATLGVMLATTLATFTILSRQTLPQAAGATSGMASARLDASASSITNETADIRNGTATHVATPAAVTMWRPAKIRPLATSIVVALWALGVLALSLRLFGGWILTRRLARHAVAAVSPAVSAAARHIADRLQLRRAVQVLESSAVVVPTLIGYVKPVVLLPALALSGLTPEQLKAILAHEFAHVRRHDYLINMLQSLVETLLFYHPAAWWVSGQVRKEREHCCDDLAVAVCGDRLVYVSALAELTSIASHRAFALAATDGSLLGRVQRLLGRPRSSHEPAPAWALLALFVLFAGSVGSFGAATPQAAVVPRPQPVAALPDAQLAEPETPRFETEAALREPAQARPAAVDLGRGSGSISWSNNGDRISIKWEGAFRLTPDEKDIEWMEGTLTIADGLLLASRAELRAIGDGRIERTFRKNGFRRDWEPEGRLFLATALDKLIRHSGVFAKERVGRFLQQGGPDAVLAEIDRLADSSYVRRIYYSELAKQADLSGELLTKILTRVPGEITSDYDKSTLFTQMAKLPAAGESHRVQIARAVRSISSDYDQRRALTAIMDVRPLPEAVAAGVLDAAGSINSNYDRSLILVEVAERGGLSASTSPAFMSLVKSMGSSYDQRRVLTAVTAAGTIPEAVAVDAIRATANMTSSHDRSETLLKMLDRGGLTDASLDAFFQSVSEIASSHDQQRVLRRAVDRLSASSRVIEGVLRTAAGIGSGHDRANLLEAVASRARVEGAARDLYVAATRGLGSYDENRALAALVRSEVRR